MRVIAGISRGRILKTLPGKYTRPTADKVKGAIFNSVGSRILETSFLDLFAGSGAVGIEALSRGARYCVFVEKNWACIKIIKHNLSQTGLERRALVIRADVLKILGKIKTITTGCPFNYIFLDPPYHSCFIPTVLKEIKSREVMAESGVVIVEHYRSANDVKGEPLLMVENKKYYGDTGVTFLRQKEQLSIK